MAGVTLSVFLLFLVVPCLAQTNLAMYKLADQTGTYGGQTADRAVDGRYTYSYCAHPNNPTGQGAEWWVDLQETYMVQRITIYNTEDGGGYPRLTNFVLSVGQTLSSLTDCGPEYTAVVGSGASVNISCDQTGRFVHFRRVGGPEVHLVTLCEVEVYGQRAYDCSRCPSGVACTEDNGCNQCASGKLPPACTDDCPDGVYGINCTSRCGRCVRPADCQPVDGVCSQGCQLWWAGDTCATEIKRPDRTTEAGSIGDVTNSSIQVTWQQITSVPRDYGSYYSYTISYKRTRDPTYTYLPPVAHTDSEYNSAVITGLEYYREYNIRITPYREMDGQRLAGDMYSTVSGKTACGYPDPPSGVSGSNFVDGSRENIMIRWNVVTDTNIRSRCSGKSAVRVEYRLVGTTEWSQESVDLTAAELIITPPGGTYQLRVVLVNDVGLATASDIQTVTIQAPTNPPTTTKTTTTTTTTTSSAIVTKETPAPSGSDNKTTTIVAVVVVMLVLVAVAVVVAVIFVRKRKQNMKRLNEDPEPTGNPGYVNATYNHSEAAVPVVQNKPRITDKPKLKIETLDKRPGARVADTVSVASVELVEEQKTKDRASPPPDPSEFDTGPVIVADLEKFTGKKKADMDRFIKEYKSLPPDNKGRCKLGQTDENKLKNRFLNIYPYDDTRVVLDLDESNDSDYINANYITGYNKNHEYIATQGPRKETVGDLWRMVWQQQANRIIMVANLVDEGKKRCAQYWPQGVGNSRTWDDFEIIMEAEEVCADYTQRTLTVVHGEQSRTVRQFHFTSWEDKNKPLHGAVTLFAFHRKVRSFDAMARGPMIVHCSAGVGRTGTFIAFDILVNQAAEEEQVDIYGVVQKLRLERMTMVQTKEQYVFLHDALVEYLKSGNTSYPATNFTQKFREIGSSNPDLGGISEVQQQFNVLTALKPRPKRTSQDGHKQANKDKNRDPDVIAEDLYRPYLTTTYKQGTNYINAVFTSSYKAHKHYIATQMPLPDTIVDFWRLVMDQTCHTVVMLNDMKTSGQTCQPYWPDEDEPKQRYGPMEVELVATNSGNTLKTVITRDFRVKLAATKSSQTDMSQEGIRVRQFQLLSWPADSELPPSRADLLDLMDLVQSWQQQRKLKPKDSHILVHCMNGAARCGMYITAAFTLEKMKLEQEIDPFLAVRYVARSRPQFISNLAQYNLLYEMALECMTRYNDYANFQ